MGKKYHNGEWLYEQYHGNGLTLKEIADKCGVTGTTISEWMDRHDIERRDQQEAQKPNKPYTDKSWLQTQYVGKGRSMSDIATDCGVSAAIILKWLRRFEIDTRDANHHHRVSPVSVIFRPEGYVSIRAKCNGEIDRVYAHQLVAIANGADPYKVFSDGEWHCHHKNGIRYDNRPENIEFKTGEDHLREHSKERVRTDTGEWE